MLFGSPKNHCMTEYVFPNAAVREAELRLGVLDTIYNPNTFRYLEELGIKERLSCFELGGGGGSVARWMSSKVGPTGHVLVTDTDIRFLDSLKELSNAEVRRHDIIKDDLPVQQFDIAHERLVLFHLPERERALDKMVNSLRSGGRVLVEEYDELALGYDSIGDALSVGLYSRLFDAKLEIYRRHGVNDLSLGSKLVRLLDSRGLKEVGMEAHSSFWRGQSSLRDFMIATYEHMRAEIISSGLLTKDEFERAIRVFDNPNWGRAAPLMVSAWGKKP